MDGILPFLKPPGITSHDAVAICRRILKEKRIGHSGTLDPMAYGVLPIFLGKATRLIEYTEGFDKTYVAECKFGTFTDTEDSSGQPVLPDTDMVLRDGVVLNESIQFSELSGSMLKPTFDELVNTLNTFVGVQDQRPSKYSAIKVNGIRAYEYARKGIPVYGSRYLLRRDLYSFVITRYLYFSRHTRNYDIFSTYSSGTFCYRFRKNSGRVNVTW